MILSYCLQSLRFQKEVVQQALMFAPTVGGTGFRKALPTSIILPSTECNFTFSPDAIVSSARKGVCLSLQATAIVVNIPAARNSLRDWFQFMSHEFILSGLVFLNPATQFFICNFFLVSRKGNDVNFHQFAVLRQHLCCACLFLFLSSPKFKSRE